jgi:hypothetical protein
MQRKQVEKIAKNSTFRLRFVGKPSNCGKETKLFRPNLAQWIT